MSGYRQGHDPGHDPYIDYGAPHPEGHPEDRGYGSHVPPELQHGGSQVINPLHELGAHQQHHQQQHHHPQVLLEQHPMAHHQSPQFGGGQRMLGYPSGQMQQQAGTKRPRQPDDLEMEMPGLPSEAQMQSGDMQVMPSQMPQQTLVYPNQPYHTHPLPNQGHRSKMPRMGDPDDSSMMQPSAPTMVGTVGMPAPAARPRGPKLKFTAEDDQLLVDLKENKSLTWKQIAEFFPGRSSGTLQVRYCTKLKAKTTQWTEETIQKLRTAIHDYEQEKWRIVAQKVGTGFTSTACKEKAREL